jgi:hypothetical protein
MVSNFTLSNFKVVKLQAVELLQDVKLFVEHHVVELHVVELHVVELSCCRTTDVVPFCGFFLDFETEDILFIYLQFSVNAAATLASCPASAIGVKKGFECKNTLTTIRGRCYDNNFLRFLPILGKKNWRFSHKPML